MNLLPSLLLPLALGISTAQVDPNLRLPVNAQIPESCAVLGVDLTHWDSGRLRVRTQCNVQRYNLRLYAGDRQIIPNEVQLISREGSIALRHSRVWLTQDRPGNLVLDLVFEEPDFESGIVRFRVEASS